MTDIVRKNSNAVAQPTADIIKQLSSGIAHSRATTRLVGGSGLPFMRMGKDGIWIIGQENTEVEEGSLWCVNTLSCQHGWVCWVRSDPNNKNSKNILAGEVMVDMRLDKPEKPEPIRGTEFVEQRQFNLRCVSGEDTGLEVTYKTPSVGGMRAVTNLLNDIQAECDAFAANAQAGDVPYVFPVLTLGSKPYNHPAHGKTFNPILTVQYWADMYGKPRPDVVEHDNGPQPEPEHPEWLEKQAEAAQPEPRTRARRQAPPSTSTPADEVPWEEPTPNMPTGSAPPRRQRRQAPEAAAAAAGPVSTQQAHIGQRRRPVAR